MKRILWEFPTADGDFIILLKNEELPNTDVEIMGYADILDGEHPEFYFFHQQPPRGFEDQT